jgi:hypothetical protein
MSNDNTTTQNSSQSHYLNEGHPNYVPPITNAQDMTRAMKNPLYQNSDNAGGDPAFRKAVEHRMAQAVANGNGLGLTVRAEGRVIADANR